MEFRKLGVKDTINQIFRKSLRKMFSVFANSGQKEEGTIHLLECVNNLAEIPYINSSFSVSVVASPPSEVYMFFPVGKAPSPSESICFVAYKGSKIAGWAWLHQGVRKDIAQAHNVKINDKVVWFGPDYVRPKYRGASLQKILIMERLKYIKKNNNDRVRMLTIVGAENKPSLHSYGYFNFVDVYQKDD